MSSDQENARPNIRIQIQNAVPESNEEKMDIDVEDHENEEGEISDDNEKDNIEDTQPLSVKKVTTGVFTTGINIFDRKEQEKLQERAKRFALKPEEINSITDKDLQELYESLGIKPTNEQEVKFESVHLIGLDEMSAEDIVDYFANYAPDSIQWIDENSCNIVWLDNLTAARAIHFKSRVVKDMPARQPKDIFPKEFLDDIEETEQKMGQSILIKNKNREVELQNEIGEIILPKKKNYPKNAADISEVCIPIPPGYWRLGNPHHKSKCLLLRFSLISDKLPFKTEKCSKYYKKILNHGQKNVISESKKNELKSIFERNKEFNQNKNPWGSLAKNWDMDAKFREREPITPNLQDDESPKVDIKNPKLMARLGTKRKLISESEEPLLEKEEDKVNLNNQKSDKGRTKIPRMKMYADEEEENMKRRKLLQSIKKQADKIDRSETQHDLRNMLGPTSRLVLKKDIPENELQVDLGTKLKNRSQKMIFAIERDLFERDAYYGDFPLRPEYPDVRSEMLERHKSRHSSRLRNRSPLESRSILLRQQKRKMSPERRRKSLERTHRSSKRRSPERTLHSDRINAKRSNLRARSYSPESRFGHKPKSKVAVVIKTAKKPSVASTIWSKVHQSSESEHSSSNSEESESTSSSSSDSESESDDKSDSSSESSKRRSRNPDRPGFDKRRLAHKPENKSPLKITMRNEHYKKQRK